MRRELAKTTFPPPPGCWCKVADKQALVCCPTCKTLIGIDGTVHNVGPTGEVRPSFVCPICRLHEFFVLRGWSPPTQQSEKR